MDQGNPSNATPPVDSHATPQSQSSADRLTLLQHAYLLEQLAVDGAATKTVGKLNGAIPEGIKRDLQLSTEVANAIRTTLAEQGYLQPTKVARSLSYTITDAGRTYFASLERPSVPMRAKPAAPIDESAVRDEIREAQNAYLLLQLLNADGQPLSKGEANRKRAVQNRLGLTPAMANYRRGKLAERGYVRATKSGTTEAYTLLPDGLEYLAAGARHLDHADFIVKGKALNALVAAARESPFHGSRPAAQAKPVAPVPERAALESAILAEFEDLRRERHRGSGLVPIHEVRQRIVERFGPSAGRHDVLDDVILGLWREHRLGLEGISDLGKATSDQLNDGIPGVSGTLFYLEAPREQPVAP